MGADWSGIKGLLRGVKNRIFILNMISREAQDRSRIKSQGAGFNCGISLREWYSPSLA